MEEQKFQTIELEKGIQYKLCTCGASKIIPFCDDSHKLLNEKTGSNFKSIKIIPENNITLKVLSKNWGEIKNEHSNSPKTISRN